MWANVVALLGTPEERRVLRSRREMIPTWVSQADLVHRDERASKEPPMVWAVTRGSYQGSAALTMGSEGQTILSRLPVIATFVTIWPRKSTLSRATSVLLS